jgi:RHS repeat-associated protein
MHVLGLRRNFAFVLVAFIVLASWARPTWGVDELRVEPDPPMAPGYPGVLLGFCGSGCNGSNRASLQSAPFAVSQSTAITRLGGWVAPRAGCSGACCCCDGGPWNYVLYEIGPGGNPLRVWRTETFGPLPCDGSSGVEIIQRPRLSYCNAYGLVYRERSIVGGCAVLQPGRQYAFVYYNPYYNPPSGRRTGCHGVYVGYNEATRGAAYNIVVRPASCEYAETCCEDGIDNDADGLVDCGDDDCSDADSQCAYFGCLPESLCANEFDDDGDGAYDCADADCDEALNCLPSESCADRIDNDRDGLIDCADADCASSPSCNENCTDGIDNNGDLDVDCADAACEFDAACLEDCDDAIDNDLDGYLDCDDDVDCSMDPACGNHEYLCGDLRDNDGDGLTDCADDNCETRAGCRDPEAEPPEEGGPGDDCVGELGTVESSAPTCDPGEVNWDLELSGLAVVLPHSGQEALEVVDYFSKGKDVVTDVRILRRHLTRVNAEHSPFGPAWFLNYRQFVAEDASGNLTHHAYGTKDRFLKIDDTRWEGRDGRFDVFVRTGPSELRMRTRGGTQLVFQLEGSTSPFVGRLISVLSPAGNQVRIEWDSVSSRPDVFTRRVKTIVDSFGRGIDFNYAGSTSDLVESITDSSGREVRYSFDADYLTGVRSPLVTSTGGINDFPNGRITRYAYRGPTGDAALDEKISHALTEVIAPNEAAAAPAGGMPRLTWTYVEDAGAGAKRGFVSAHVVGNRDSALGDRRAGGTFSYDYEPMSGVGGAVMRTSVVNRRGTETEFVLTRQGQKLSQGVFNTRRSTLPSRLETGYAYTPDGSPIVEFRPLGNAVTHRRSEIQAGERSSQSNRLATTRHADAFRGGDQSAIGERIIYEPIFNHPFKVIGSRGLDEGDEVGYTTTHVYDYMEDLPAATTHFAAEMGLERSVLVALLDEAGVEDLGEDVNGDGTRSQWFGQLIRVDHPKVQFPQPQQASETLIYNEHGQLVRQVDAEGNVTTFEYFDESDPAGLGPLPAGAAGGYLRRIVRDAEPGLDREGGENPAPVVQVTELQYGPQLSGAYPANEHGVPTATLDPRGIKHLHLVNELDEEVRTLHAADVSASTDPTLVAFGYAETWIRDANGNVVRHEVVNDGTLDPAPAPIVTTYEHDILDRVIRRIDDAGGIEAITLYGYDEAGNLVSRVQAAGTDDEQREAWTYDDLNQMMTHSTQRSPTEIATTHYDVDANGNLTRIVDADGPGFGVGDETTFSYDGFDRLRTVMDRTGATRLLRYDAASNKVQETWQGPVTPLSGEALLANTTWRYDERNRPFHENRELFQHPGRTVGTLDPADGNVSWTTTHDRLGRPVRVVDPDGLATLVSYDGLSRVLAASNAAGDQELTTYDASGNATQSKRVERSPLLSAAEEFVTIRSFDALDRLASIAEPNGQTTRFSHDSRGNVVRSIDQLENEIEFRHDRLGRLVDQRTYLSSTGTGASATNLDPGQGGGDGVIKLTSTWDKLGRLRSRTDDRLNETRYSYDPLGGVRSIEFADGTSELRSYSLDGELRTVLRQDGQLQEWTTDAEGRPTQLRVGSVLTPTLLREWQYDGLGRLVHDFDSNGYLEDVSYDYWYDSLSRVIRERQTVGATPPLDVDSEYAGANRLVRITQPSGRVIAHSPDGAGRLGEIRAGTGGSLIARYDWVGGRPLRLTLGNGLVMDRRDPTSGSTIAGPLAGYDANGRPTRSTWRTSVGADVAQWVSTWNGPGGVGTNRRIQEDRVVVVGTPHARTDAWTLDSSYRQVSFNRNGSPAARVLDGANKMTSFVEDGLAHSIQVDGVPAEAGMNQYSAIDGLSRTYSYTGSLDDDAIKRYFWDATDRLVRVSDSGSGDTLAEYVRSADGRVVLRRADGQPGTRHVYRGWQEIEERSLTGTVLREHVTGLGIDEHLQMRDSQTGAVYYLHASDLGSVGVMTDATGAPVERYEYTWLGRPLITDVNQLGVLLPVSPRGNPHLFQGRRWVPETQLYDFRNRYFDPQWGEFLSIDPLGNWAHGMGTGYEGFSGDSWNQRDPLGLDDTFEDVIARQQAIAAQGNPNANKPSIGLVVQQATPATYGQPLLQPITRPAAAVMDLYRDVRHEVGYVGNLLPDMSTLRPGADQLVADPQSTAAYLEAVQKSANDRQDIVETVLDEAAQGVGARGLGLLARACRRAGRAFAARGGGDLVDLASPGRRRHILEGDATGGGHRAGTGLPGKSEFPAGWSDDQVMHHIADIATDPAATRTAGRGGRTVVDGTRDGIDIRVILAPDGSIVTGFPTNVPRNPR